MTELELTRVPGDRRAFELAGVGSLRLQGRLSRSARAEAGGRGWDLRRRGLLRATVWATDAAGAVAGEFRQRGLRRGGVLRWGDRELALRPASTWRERYALADGDRELATFDGKGWGKRPVKVALADSGDLDAGLVLFAAYVVRQLAEDAAASVATSPG